ncbi:MAG: MerR family transcriptional regulator [Chloroflexota bacterium]
MFKIGDFSKISQVSIRSLRHYDAIGLFKPAQTDRFTGYRYYTAAQLPQLNRIIALKELGLSLEQVTLLMQEDLPASEMRGMLRLKQAELRQQIADEETRLMRVESRLRQIEQEGRVPRYDPVIKPVEAQTILSVRTISFNLEAMGDLLTRTYETARRQVREVGHGVGIFYDAYFDTRDTDWEIGFTVPDDFNGKVAFDDQRALTLHSLPAVEQMACVVYQGGYVGLHQGYGALGTWIEQNGYVINGDTREVFLNIDLEVPEACITEIQYPIARIESRFDPLKE